MPTTQSLLWLCTGAYGIHVLEEFVFDWRNWARNVLHLPVCWNDFYITNMLVIVLGVVAAEVVPAWPVVGLAYPALMLINAVFFHIGPFVFSKGRFSPGLITAVLLFFPAAVATFRIAGLHAGGIFAAFVIGAAAMATPIVFLKLKTKPYFDQTRA